MYIKHFRYATYLFLFLINVSTILNNSNKQQISKKYWLNK